ncbi:PAS domain-containing protein [Rhizobium sp. TH2]|uniref:helix-turn-helix transcriptional regulator n=1 Tax=Rhizobium sp. TH2 TaxID=2775403 RepID=UPI002157D5A0|nr:PAS domain-containing protein [Rhizobium sp. TH2]UVC10927.1 PAS domain-containing protein [Rhizobium sp. TH2]
MVAIDIRRLQYASMHLSDVVAEPARWAEVLEEITQAVGAIGAGLIPQTGSEGAVATANLRDCLETYVRESWTEQDRVSHLRSRALLMRGEIALDRDLANADDRAPFFEEFLPRFDGRWWAGIGIRSGSDIWSLTMHRSLRQGPYEQSERAILQQFSLRLNEVGSLAELAGRVTLSAVANSFDQMGKAVVAIDETGRFIHANAAATQLLGAAIQVAGGRLIFRDRHAAAEYSKVIERLRGLREGKILCAPPIIVRRENATPLAIRILPVDGAAKSPFLSARALLLLNEIMGPAKSDWQAFSRAFGLTPAEARLAALLAIGDSLENAASALGITRETARSRLKSIFQKTDTHRQGQLVALLASLV